MRILTLIQDLKNFITEHRFIGATCAEIDISGTDDCDYQGIFCDEILPGLHELKPQLLPVSAGFDAHKADPLASIALTEKIYEWLGWQLRKVAHEYSDGKLLSVLESGYNPKILGGSVASCIIGAH